jgi:hypothetical protein
VRNIPRRRAQTTLIVLGLMLSTLIISAAFTTGDTVQRSITGEVYSLLGSVDEVILVRGVGEVTNDEEEAFGGDQDVITRQIRRRWQATCSRVCVPCPTSTMCCPPTQISP